MANLQAYLDFTVQLKVADGKIVITDTSNYPNGVATEITGIVTVRQPDGITITGEWATPDTTWNGAIITKAQKELRLQSDNTPQSGTYTVTYQVDHPDYTPTSRTKEFYLNYNRPVISISRGFDVFTPSLKAIDTTSYTSSAFNVPTVSRYWLATVGNITTLYGSDVILNLAYSSNYYDATYGLTLTSTLAYQHGTYAFLSLTDTITGTLNTVANTPPKFPVLTDYLKVIKARFDGLAVDQQTVDAKQVYVEAESLLQHIKNRICAGDTVNLDTQIQNFLNIYYGYTFAPYVNTNVAISTYDYSGVQCGGGTTIVEGDMTDIRITDVDINNWNFAYASIPPPDLEYIVGATEGAPAHGTNSFSHPTFTGWRLRLYRNHIPLYTLNNGSGVYYTKVQDTNTVLLNGDTFNNGDILRFAYYAYSNIVSQRIFSDEYNDIFS